MYDVRGGSLKAYEATGLKYRRLLQGPHEKLLMEELGSS